MAAYNDFLKQLPDIQLSKQSLSSLLGMDSSGLESLLNITAPICTMLQFLTGVPACIEFVRKRSTGETSALPYVAGALNCSVWLTYGFAIDQPAIQMVNGIGALLMISYSVCFYQYTHRKVTVLRQMVFAAGFFLTLIFVLSRLRLEVDPEEADDREKTILGYIAAGLSVAFSSAPLASVGHVVRVRSAEALPFWLIVMTFLVTSQWWLFGVIIDDGFVQYPNMIGSIVSMLQLGLFVAYPASGGRIHVRKKTASEEQLL